VTETLRRSVDVDGLDHGGQPIPNACRIGDTVWTGGISGIDRTTGNVPAALSDEIRLLFENVRAVAHEAGVDVGDIGRVTIFVRQRSGEISEALNAEWTAMFPDPASRPARHLLVQDIHQALRIQCDFIAVARQGSQ
jgi:enamine deaminase RidA (YjgF/YER057c/UK114 family)